MAVSNKMIGILKFAQWERCRDIFTKITSASLVIIDDLDDLSSLDALIIPRGPSMDFSSQYVTPPWDSAIELFLDSGKPLLSICGSLICFAKTLGHGCEGRKTFGRLDAEVINDEIHGTYDVILDNSTHVSGDFTDAPVLRKLGGDIEIKARCEEEVVGIRQGNFWSYSYYDDSGESYEEFVREIAK